MIITERPAFTQNVIMLARKNGEYIRPIIGDVVDIRIEDFIPNEFLVSAKAQNYIGKLPDIPGTPQINKYLVAYFNLVMDVDVDEKAARDLLNSNEYTILPHDQSSELWEYTKSPWWEYAVVIDSHNGFIKAPKIPRSGEPTADDIDERLDDFEENAGKMRVTSPEILLTNDQDYTAKLARI